MDFDVVDAFYEDDRPRVTKVLDDLLRTVTDRYLFVGGISIRCNLLAATGQIVERPFNDLDLIANGPGSFRPQLTGDFLVHHFHMSTDTSDFRFVLVHKTTGTKVDILHWKPASPIVTRVNHRSPDYADRLIDIQAMPTQFAATIYDLKTMLARGPIDPKQLQDALAMAPFVTGPQAMKSWRELFNGPPPCSLTDVLEDARYRTQAQPSSFYIAPWRSYDIDYKCAKCVDSAAWPLASMEEIKALLGYVEIDGKNVF